MFFIIRCIWVWRSNFHQNTQNRNTLILQKSPLWIENRQKSLSDESETCQRHVWQHSNHIWSFRPCKSKSGQGCTRSGHQNGHMTHKRVNNTIHDQVMTILMTWTGTSRSTFAFTWSKWSDMIAVLLNVSLTSFWLIWKRFFGDFRFIEVIFEGLWCCGLAYFDENLTSTLKYNE